MAKGHFGRARIPPPLIIFLELDSLPFPKAHGGSESDFVASGKIAISDLSRRLQTSFLGHNIQVANILRGRLPSSCNCRGNPASSRRCAQMSPPLASYLFGISDAAEQWEHLAPRRVAQHSTPTADEFAQLLDEGEGAVALIAAKHVRPDDVVGALSTGADVTVVVANAKAATGGRGCSDLAGMLWQTAPAIACLLGDALLDAGAVLFGPEARARLRKMQFADGDAISSAVIELVTAGANLRAVLLPGDFDAAPAPHPPALTPNSPPKSRRWLAQQINRLESARFVGGVTSPADATAIRAGLLLWHDFLDESHSVSQSIEGAGRRQAGDYWHAIMHRREPDYGNAKYWFRRVGRHPVFESLAARGERLVSDVEPLGGQLLARLAPGGTWDPFAFVDACREAAGTRQEPLDLLLRRFQADEMLLLLWQTCQDARGG
jgi:hypothetical protein